MRPTRQTKAIDEIVDIFGAAHLVCEYRETGHGWLIAIGWPLESEGPGGAAIILTQPLADYLSGTPPKDMLLPIGGTAAKRLRRIGNLYYDRAAWWDARYDDLMTMTLDAFCAKHGTSIGAASQHRKKKRNENNDSP